MQQPLLAFRQPIDARRQHRLHGGRHASRSIGVTSR